MIPRALRLAALATLLAGCGSSSSDAPSTGTRSRAPSETSAEAPPSSAPSAMLPPPVSASAAAPANAGLPSADPLPLRASTGTAAPSATTLPPAGTSASASARPREARAPQSPDAGAVSTLDAGAATPSAGQRIAQQVDAIFAAKKTFSAHFKQQYTPKFAGSVKDSSGTVFVERPSKISFRYDPPSKNRIVSDGSTIKVYIAEDSQMFETPAQKTQYPGALAFMLGNGISSSFDFAINDRASPGGRASAPSTYDGVVLDGKPLSPNPSYETVMFFIDRGMLAAADPGVIRRVLIVDAQGNKNRFDFDGGAQPATIDPAEFTFTPPPGTSIRR